MRDEAVNRVRATLSARHGIPDAAIRVVQSPYRLCPIGAHIDHQGGPVLGMAIDLGTLLAFAAIDSPEVTISSEDYPGDVRLACDERLDTDVPDWGRYVHGAVRALRPRLTSSPCGLVGHVSGSLPGAGLSSSASVLLAYLVALAHVNAVPLEPCDLVERCLHAERDHVGVEVGILDPASIVASRRNHLTVIDTQATRWETVPLGSRAPGHRLLVAFSGVTRNLAQTDYNRRVHECREAAMQLGALAGRPDVRILQELPDGVLHTHGGSLPAVQARRARHFFGERARVQEGIDRWRRGDLHGFGRLMQQSCASSIENWECGSRELVEIQRILTDTPGVLGSRFSGGGWGGCCVALIDGHESDTIRRVVERSIATRLPELAGRARVFLVSSEDGVRVM